MSWNNQGGGPWRSPGRGPWGQGPIGPQPTGDLEEIIRRVQEALGKLTPGGSGAGGKGLGGRGALFARARRAAALVRLGDLLYRPAERSRHQSGVRPLYRQNSRGPEHQLALADRLGDQGSGLGSADHRSRLSQSRRQHGHSRRKPDADRRQEYRRRSLPGELADRPGEARRLRVQHPQPARDGQGGRREHHARGRRPEDDRRHPHHRPHLGRGRRAKTDAGPAQRAIGPAFSSSRCSCSPSTRRARSFPPIAT